MHSKSLEIIEADEIGESHHSRRTVEHAKAIHDIVLVLRMAHRAFARQRWREDEMRCIGEEMRRVQASLPGNLSPPELSDR